MKAAWPSLVVTDDSVTQCIADIRRALDDRKRVILKTVHRQGYCLVPDRLETDAIVFDVSRAKSKTVRSTAKSSSLIGRQDELRILNDAIRDAKVGSKSFVLVVGDPGVGKTRLINEPSTRLARSPYVVAQSQCYPLSVNLGYGCLAAWLGSSQVSAGLAGLNAECRNEVSRIVPELLDQSASAASSQEFKEPWNKIRFFAALYKALTYGGQPVVLLLDNLQWCDSESIYWLSYALRQSDGQGIVVLASMRSGTELTPAITLLIEQMVMIDRLRGIELGPLTRAESVRLATALSSRWQDAIDTGELYKFSTGNPLFIVELVRSIRDSDRPVIAASSRLQEAIFYRVARLSNSAQLVLQQAAAVGHAFGAELLAKSLKSDLTSVVLDLSVLVEQHFLEPHARGYNFPHDLIREVIYNKVDEEQSRRIHQSLALALDCPDLGGEEEHINLATHYAHAHQWSEALHHYRRAASHARAKHANHAELGALRGAIAMLDKLVVSTELQHLRIEILLDLGLAESVMHGWGAQAVGQAWEQAYALAAEVGTVSLKARTINGLDTWYRDSGQWHRSEIVSEAALDLLPQIDDAYLRLCLKSSHGALLLHKGRPELALETYDQVIAESNEQIVPSFNWFNSTFTVGANFRSAQALWLLDRVEAAQERAEHALELSLQRSDPFHRVITLFHVALLYEFGRDSVNVFRLAREMSEVAARYEYGFYRSSAALFIALANLRMSGDQKELVLIEGITRQQQIAGTRMFEPYWQANLAEAYLIVGEAKMARGIARQAIDRSARTRNQYWDAGLWTIIGQSLQGEFGACNRSQDAFESAIRCAQRQGAKRLESRAKDARGQTR